MMTPIADLEELWRAALWDDAPAHVVAFLAREGAMSREELTPSFLALAEAAGISPADVERLHQLGADERRVNRQAGRIRAEQPTDGPLLKVEPEPGMVRLRLHPRIWHRHFVNLPLAEAAQIHRQLGAMLAVAAQGADVPAVPPEGPLAEEPSSMPILYAALFSIAPDRHGNGGMELAAPGYARAVVAFEPGDAPRSMRNREIIFPEALEQWPPAVAMGLFEAPTGRDWAVLPPLIFGAPMVIERGMSAQLSPGTVSAQGEE